MADRKITVLDAVEETDLANDNTLIQFVNPDRVLAIDRNRRGTLASVASGALRRVPDGSAGTPAVRFASDPDTGMYRNSANVIAFASGGVRTVTIGGTKPLRVQQSGVLYEAWHAGNLPYEIGTWTPEIQSTGTFPTLTYVKQEGRYTRIGNMAYISALITWSERPSAGTGNLRPTIPFNVVSTPYDSFSFTILSGIAIGAGLVPYARAFEGASRSRWWAYNPGTSGTGEVTVSALQTTGGIGYSGIVQIQ